MINTLKNNDKIKFEIFGKETELEVFTDRLGFKETYLLNQEELSELNWLLENIVDETIKEKIIDYCNENYRIIGENSINDVYPEIDLNSIYIFKEENIIKIAILGECKSDPEHGISIKFEDRIFIGIGQNSDWF